MLLAARKIHMSYNQRVSSSIQATFRALACTTLVALIVLVYVKLLHVNPTTVALTFLLAILTIAAAWGLRYAIPMSIASALCFNFFFLPPVDTFTIADTQNWVALFAFFFTSVIASNLSERARRQTWEAHQRTQEVERLYAFSQQLLVAENVVALLQRVPGFVTETFSAREAAIYLSNKDQIYRSDPDRQNVTAEQLI
jgi:two-component system sensor histidine kinase KdpD